MHGSGVVHTALGDVQAKDLGKVLVHEHLIYAWPGFEHDAQAPYWAHQHPATQVDRAGLLNHLVDSAKELVDLGISTIVDPCPIEMGRSPEMAAEVSERSGLNIVVATGNFMEHLGMPMYIRMRPVDELVDIYTQELTSGIGSTGIKAGVIKTASGGVPGLVGDGDTSKITPSEEKVHHAAGITAAATGAPIVCHNDERDPAGREQLAIFTEEGCPTNQVLIGHADAVADMRYYFDILDSGAFLGFDRWGGLPMAPEKLRIASFLGLTSVGYTDQLCISADAVAGWAGRREPGIIEQQDTHPDWTWSHIPKRVIPWLREAGLSDGTLDSILTDNPRRWLTGVQ
jgi:phosphotriesterase-related protein